MNYIMTFDVGTTNTKAALVDLKGIVHKSCSVPMTVYHPQPNYSEQKPEEWWEAVSICSRKLMSEGSIKPGEVAGVGFSTLAMSITLVDENSNLLLPASMIWMDERAEGEAERLRNRFGGTRISEKLLGVKVTGHYWLPKYLWVKRYQNDLYRKARAVLDPIGYLCLRATGELVCEWTQASTTGLFDLKKKQWNDGIIRLMKLDRDKFMPLVKSTDKVGTLTAQAAKDMGLPESTPVFGGATDAMAATVGSGISSTGEGVMILGTSGNVAMLTDKKLTGYSGFASSQSGDPDKLYYVGTSNTTGACLSFAANTLYGNENGTEEAYNRINEDINAARPGADGLLFGPWMVGERAPYPDGSLHGCFLNLKVNHTRQSIVRAIGEGIAHNYAVMLERMEKVYGAPIPTIRAVGGVTRNLVLMQIFADIMNRNIEVVRDASFGGSVGIALMSAAGLGEYSSVSEAAKVVQTEHRFEPNPQNRAVYDDAHKKFQRLYPAVAKWYHTAE